MGGVDKFCDFIFVINNFFNDFFYLKIDSNVQKPLKIKVEH